MADQTNEQLAGLAKTGDNFALEELVARFLPEIYRYSYSLLKNRMNAEDASQEIFVKVWKNLHRFDESKDFRPWIFKIAKNTCLDIIKKIKSENISEYDDSISLGFFDLENNLEVEAGHFREFVVDELNRAVGQLKPEYAKVVVLHHSDGMKFREISQLLKQPLNTVKSRYLRAIRVLKKNI